MNYFDVAQDATHIAYVTYADNAVPGFAFPGYHVPGSEYSKEDVFSLIDAIPSAKGDSRHLHLGLNEAIKTFSEKQGGRRAARKVLISDAVNNPCLVDHILHSLS